MLIHVVNQAGVRGSIHSTYATTGNPSDDKRIVSLHAEDGELMQGYPFPLFPPVAPEEVVRRSEEWAMANGWSRVPDEG